jgi:2-oxoglutarate dehydrogenase E2 component (dihydrolipoamide succinyltransferase)
MAAPAAVPPAATAAAAPAVAADEVRVSPVAARLAADKGIDPARVPASGRSGQVTRSDVERFVAAGGAEAPAADRAMGFISPRVARLAAEHGVDLRQVPGTGREGRVTARDVEAHVASRAAAPAAPSAPATGPSTPAAPAAGGPGLGELVALTPMRKAIAEHMVHSIRTSPHVTTVHEVDMSAVMATNATLKAAYAARGIKLTLTAFIMQCLAEAIRRHPLVNSSWTDAGIQIHPSVNIGMAVALPGGGLIVPVIKQADEKNLSGMAKAVADLATRARDRKLAPDDVQGGTFTVTNYGTLGSLFGTPVINQPQTAILGTGAIKKRVVVVESPAGDSIAIRPMMLLSLTFDHRVLDGGTADPFMQSLVRLLEAYRP